MRCPSLNDLPNPPLGKTGWAWTEECPQLSETMPDGSPWPRISIVTPSYNQAHFIEETIRSVLLQGYPNLEYIIIDGGSTDGSVEIIKKYEPWLAYWVSEPDRGQSHAINKGMARATGQLVAWINSDDIYKLDTLCKVACLFAENPNFGIVYGKAEALNESSKDYKHLMGQEFEYESMITKVNQIPQPSAFILARAYWEMGGLIEEYNYSFDYDLWLKIASQYSVKFVDDIWSSFRFHDQSKTVSNPLGFDMENLQIMKNFLRNLAQSSFGKERILTKHILRIAQDYQDLGDKQSSQTWLFRALLNDPKIAFTENKYRGAFYTLVFGEKMKLVAKLLRVFFPRAARP